MNNRRIIVLCIPLLASCVTNVVPDFEIEAAVFAPNLTGDAQKGSGNNPLSVDRDLGLDDREYSPSGGASVAWAGARAEISGFRSKFDGNDTVTGGFGSIGAGTVVDTEGTIANVRGAVLVDLVNVGVLRLSPGIGLDLIDADFQVESATAKESIEGRAAIPLVVVNGEVDLGVVRGVVDVGAMHGDFGDSSGTFVDGLASVRFPLRAPAELFIGYRYLRFDFEGKSGGDDFDESLRLHGPMAGLALRF
jgi:hypothetical protein